MTAGWDCSLARVALGVHVLGVIDAGERALLDAHLADCADCRAELAELEGLPAMLALVPAQEATAVVGPAVVAAQLAALPQPALPQPALPRPALPRPAGPALESEESAGREPAGLPELPAQPAAQPAAGGQQQEPVAPVIGLSPGRRAGRGRRSVALAGAAAGVAVVAGAASFGGASLAGRPGPAPRPAAVAPAASAYPNGAAQGPWQQASGSSPGAAATVAYRVMGYGLQLEAKVSGIPVDTPCQLWIVTRQGTRVYAGSWVTDADEGAVWYQATASADAASVQAFVIGVSGGQPISVTPA